MGIQSSGCAAVDAIGNIVITGNTNPAKMVQRDQKRKR